jgi:signal transduction histidine kinase
LIKYSNHFSLQSQQTGHRTGLSLSYDIVKAHGGELKVESKAEEGTVFTIQLPGKNMQV